MLPPSTNAVMRGDDKAFSRFPILKEFPQAAIRLEMMLAQMMWTRLVSIRVRIAYTYT